MAGAGRAVALVALGLAATLFVAHRLGGSGPTAEAGVDAVKFQTFKTETFVAPSQVERFKRMSSKKEEFGVLAMSIFKRYILTAFLPSLGQ